ncbi:MAG: hypothetical protein GY756_17830 [bacterium]|nr:hypothetical protein [bacterium]
MKHNSLLLEVVSFLNKEWAETKGKNYYRKEDFHFDSITGKLICSAGNPTWLKCKNFQSGNRYYGKSYMGHIKNCVKCKLRSKCIRKETTKAKQIAIFDSSNDPEKRTFTMRIEYKNFIDFPHKEQVISTFF